MAASVFRTIRSRVPCRISERSAAMRPPVAPVATAQEYARSSCGMSTGADKRLKTAYAHPRRAIFRSLIRRRKRVVFMQDAPLPADFPQTNRQSEFKRLAAPGAIDVHALPFCSGERHVRAGSDFNIYQAECDGLFGVREKQPPSIHVRIESARMKRGRHIEHEQIHVVVRADRIKILISHRARPTIQQRSNLFGVVAS